MERGVRVSGGQRQRIALARALYGQPELLVLDDPFSAIDINMEKTIMSSLRNLTANMANPKLILLFSHRLSMFPLCDQIIVLDKGRIIQMGTHINLLPQDGLYRDIYSAQEFIRASG
jgi:ABC-type multidrug transport system fused ATPase/permease subunit